MSNIEKCPGGKGEIYFLTAAFTEVIAKEGRHRTSTKILKTTIRIDCTPCRLHQVCSHVGELESGEGVDRVINQALHETQDLCPEQPTSRDAHLRVVK